MLILGLVAAVAACHPGTDGCSKQSADHGANAFLAAVVAIAAVAAAVIMVSAFGDRAAENGAGNATDRGARRGVVAAIAVVAIAVGPVVTRAVAIAVVAIGGIAVALVAVALVTVAVSRVSIAVAVS